MLIFKVNGYIRQEYCVTSKHQNEDLDKMGEKLHQVLTDLLC